MTPEITHGGNIRTIDKMTHDALICWVCNSQKDKTTKHTTPETQMFRGFVLEKCICEHLKI